MAKRMSAVQLERRHYEVIAEIISTLPPSLRDVVARAVADQLGRRSGKFKEHLFLAACDPTPQPKSGG